MDVPRLSIAGVKLPARAKRGWTLLYDPRKVGDCEGGALFTRFWRAVRPLRGFPLLLLLDDLWRQHDRRVALPALHAKGE